MINYDHANYDCCTLNTAAHISESLGTPLTLPPTLADKLSESWANECEEDLLALFELMTGAPYKQAARDNTYNNQTDLDNHVVFTVYADESCPDWCWRGDTFVVCEIGKGGDPRYCGYDLAGIYRVDSLAETGFLDFVLGWWAEPISDRYDPSELDRVNDRLSIGYSSNPTCELGELAVSEPLWSDKRNGYVCRFDGVPYPCVVRPHAPHYGG